MNSVSDKSLFELILPQGILEYFSLTSFTSTSHEINIYLEEKNIMAEVYKGFRLTSKGFFDEITVQDFPLRGKAVFLHIKRWRWLNQTTSRVVFRDWNMVAQGTRMTTEFASFLKALPGYQAGKLQQSW